MQTALLCKDDAFAALQSLASTTALVCRAKNDRRARCFEDAMNPWATTEALRRASRETLSGQAAASHIITHVCTSGQSLALIALWINKTTVQSIMHSFAVALLLSSAAAFAPKAASRPSVAVAAMPSQDELKKQVGYQAIDDYVTSGMKVGLGTGSTAAFAVERLGMLLKDGTLKDIIAVPTSVRTKEQAEELGIPLTTLDEFSRLDVAIDGADEVDPDLNLVKGGGGALLREKMVEIVADKFIVIVDESKLCDALGPGFPVRSRRPVV